MAESTSGRVGGIDRALRFILGLVLVTFALFCPFAAQQGPWVMGIAGFAGIVLVGTAAVRFCPLYRVLGICTG